MDTNILKDMEEEEITKIVNEVILERFDKGQIIKEHDQMECPLDSLVIIVQGTVDILTKSEGKLVKTLKKGDFFGGDISPLYEGYRDNTIVVSSKHMIALCFPKYCCRHQFYNKTIGKVLL